MTPLIRDGQVVRGRGAVDLFLSVATVLHSGETSSFKIDCDALSDEDIATLAGLVRQIMPPYGSVEGVPTGGLRLAAALASYATEGPLLVADDVLTTGGSIEAQRAGRPANGVVLFSRGAPPAWVTPLFALHPAVDEPWAADDDIHQFFGLAYANYLVLHRTLLQSMPDTWQRAFVALLRQLERAFDHVELPPKYRVQGVDDAGRFVRDVVPHYERGRARVEPRWGL